MPVSKITECPVCQSGRLAQLPVPGRWIGEDVFGKLKGQLGLARCRDCGFRFTSPRPDSAALTEFYDGTTYVCHDADSEDSTRGSGYLLPLLGKPGRLLDFGCGAGAFLALARAAGWDANGYEPGSRGREACAARELPVTADLGSLADHSFDAITAVHVYEHVPDLRATLAEFRRLLRPGGRLCLEVPNARSLRARLAPLSSRFDERYRAFPIHLSYFTFGSMRTLFGKNGWDVETLTTSGMGVEELVSRVPAKAKAAPAPTRASTSSRPRSKSRRFLRNAFMWSGLGENIVVVCKPQ